MKPAGPHLRDIHPPPPPSWWPPAYGWWILAAVLLATIAMLSIVAWKRYRRRRRWQRWERVFEQLHQAYQRTGDTAGLARQVSELLRRAARLHDPGAVRLKGEAWHVFLAKHAPEGLQVSALASLEDAMYQRHPSVDDDAVLAAARAWMRHAMRVG